MALADLLRVEPLTPQGLVSIILTDARPVTAETHPGGLYVHRAD